MFKLISGTTRQVKLWAFFAGTLPITVLAFICLAYFFGWTDIYHKTLILAGLSFFFVAVLWWWWAIFKIAKLAILIDRTNDNFDSVIQDLREIKKISRDIANSN